MYEVKKILIPVSGGFIARNIIRSGVLDFLLKTPVEVVLAVFRDKQEYYQKEFGSPRVTIVALPEVEMNRGEQIISFLARNTLRIETVAMLQKTEYCLRGKAIFYFFKRAVSLLFGRSRVFHVLLRWCDRSLLSQNAFRNLLIRIQPDVLFATNVIERSDVALIREAKRLGIKTVGMVKSWDNLMNHGLVRIISDTVIVHNPFLKRHAVLLHHIPEEKINVVGIPQYDWYTRKDLYISREEFFRSVGIDPKKKLILFAGEGDYIAPREWEVAQIIGEAISAEKISSPAIVLFRPHPNFLTHREKIKTLRNVVFDDFVAEYIGTERSTWEMREKEMAHLVNSLRHADVVINTASTMIIDAVAFAKPVVCIAFDGVTPEPYLNSVRRYYRDFTHNALIAHTGGFKIAYTAEELIQYVNQYFQDPVRDAEGRQRIFDDYIWKLDGKSSERLAAVLLKELSVASKIGVIARRFPTKQSHISR